MGYTHYWKFLKPKSIKGQHSVIEQKYQLAIRQCQRIVRGYNAAMKGKDEKHPARLSGYSAHTKVNDYLGLEFNGTADLAYETFTMRDHWSANEEFNFCKTGRMPYDVVVTACLIVMQHYLKDLFEIGSDGNAQDWQAGLNLAKEVTKIKSLTVPKGLE